MSYWVESTRKILKKKSLESRLEKLQESHRNFKIIDKTCKLMMLLLIYGALMQDQRHNAFLEAMQYNYGLPSQTSKQQTSRAWSLIYDLPNMDRCNISDGYYLADHADNTDEIDEVRSLGQCFLGQDSPIMHTNRLQTLQAFEKSKWSCSGIKWVQFIQWSSLFSVISTTSVGK